MPFFFRSPKEPPPPPDPVLNLPPEDSEVWNVTRDYDRFTSSRPSSRPESPSSEISTGSTKQKTSGCKKRSNTLKSAADVYVEETLSSLKFEGLAVDHEKKIADRLFDGCSISELQHPRSALEGSAETAVNGMNEAGGGMNGSTSLPIHAGQQMDLNFIYSKVLELSEQLRANREQTQGLIAGAEELANRAASPQESPDTSKGESQASIARIADLTRKLAEAESINKVLLREQRENGKLIGEYEQALEKVVAMLRDYAYNKESEKGKLAKQYLNTLQAERDEHLKTRLERDTSNTHILKLMAQMRQAHHLAVEESRPELEIVAGLQNEVRSLRNALGLPKEAFEDETGYSVLKHVQGGPGEEDD